VADVLFRETTEPTITVGDFNIDTAITDQMRVLLLSERRTGELYMRAAALQGHMILNMSGIHIRFPDNLIRHGSSTIDSTLANGSLFSKMSRWRD